jgi:hypothetical protein
MSSNSHFDEKSGIIYYETSFGSFNGRWSQTVNEVVVEIDVDVGTRGKDVRVVIKPSLLECHVKGNLVFKVKNILLKHDCYTILI